MMHTTRFETLTQEQNKHKKHTDLIDVACLVEAERQIRGSLRLTRNPQAAGVDSASSCPSSQRLPVDSQPCFIHAAGYNRQEVLDAGAAMSRHAYS